MKGWLLILIFLCQPLAVFCVHFQHIGMKEGLSQTSVMSIHQDMLGRMWFGTREGITIYDGNSITSIKPGASYLGNISGSIHLGNICDFIVSNKEGDVFFRSDGAFIRYDIHKEQFLKIHPNEVMALSTYEGEIWCAVEDSLFSYDAEGDSLRFQVKTNIPSISCLLVLDNQIWVGSNHGLFVMNHGSHPRVIVPDKDIYSIFQSSTKDIYIGTRMEGLHKISPDGTMAFFQEKASPGGIQIASNQIREFIEDNQGNIWFGTFRGLQKYNPSTGELSLYNRNNLPGGLSHSSVFSLYFDRQGTIWAGTYYGGVNYFNPERDIFSHYVDNPNRADCLSYPFVGNMVEDKDGDLWICTEGGGLNYFNREKKVFRHYLAESKNGPPHNNLKSISYDEKRDMLYIGTHTGGLSKFHIPSQQFYHYLKQPQNPNGRRPNDIIYNTEIYDNHLYISARNGLYKMDLDTEEFSYLNLYCVNFSIDTKGYLWFFHSGKLVKLNLNDTSDVITISPLKFGIGFNITQITEYKDNIYFSTLGTGFFKFNESDSTFTPYTVESGHLTSNYCYNIAQTKAGHLIITTDNGITLFDPQQESSRFVKLGVSLPITSITEGCGLTVCRDGEIFVGGTDGLTSFQEELLNFGEKDYSLYFTDIQVHNKQIAPYDNSNILSQALPFTNQINLRYNQNNIVVSFTSSNYVNIQKNNEYEYMLEGFDTQWNPAQSNTIHYTNLNPGSYRLIVREKPAFFNAAEAKEIALNIHISQPWYNTLWAWIGYIIVTSSILFFIIHTRNARKKLALTLLQEQQEKERNEQLTQAKLRFFTNISHEFRVPLTLITSQIELMLQSSALSPHIYNQILKISKNANRMRGLINELLEFRKLEQNSVTLRVSEQPLVPFLNDIYLSFREIASKKRISFALSGPEETPRLWFDAYQLQKVFFNLLSNAFKFTREGGTVEIVVKEKRETVSILVIDNGTGLTPKEAKQVFDLFYQAENGMSPADSNHGTGIGLALSQSIVQLHHGEITVQSEQGYGTMFIVELLKGKSHFEQDNKTIIMDHPEEPIPQESLLPELLTDEEYENLADTLPPPDDGKRYTVLLVEDNEELLQILKTLFEPLYNTLVARDGKEGLDMVIKEKPDLVVSDVMMPRMTGTEMCLHIKNNIDICHIPVVLLTALDSVEKNIEGLQQGADDYIGKPFHSKILLTRCNNLIRNRALLQHRMSEQNGVELSSLAVNPLDQDLLKRINHVIEEHINNPEFDMDQLANEVGVSRSSLFAKFKALTGITPNEFIKNERLKRAATMLREHPEMQIVEIAEQLGFGSSVYFSRIFKAHYGVSPAQYRKQ